MVIKMVIAKHSMRASGPESNSDPVSNTRRQ